MYKSFRSYTHEVIYDQRCKIVMTCSSCLRSERDCKIITLNPGVWLYNANAYQRHYIYTSYGTYMHKLIHEYCCKTVTTFSIVSKGHKEIVTILHQTQVLSIICLLGLFG